MQNVGFQSDTSALSLVSHWRSTLRQESPAHSSPVQATPGRIHTPQLPFTKAINQQGHKKLSIHGFRSCGGLAISSRDVVLNTVNCGRQFVIWNNKVIFGNLEKAVTVRCSYFLVHCGALPFHGMLRLSMPSSKGVLVREGCDCLLDRKIFSDKLCAQFSVREEVKCYLLECRIFISVTCSYREDGAIMRNHH